jgi:hypothetical protein
MRLNNGRSTMTNSAGYYTSAAVANGSYTTTPVLSGYSFDLAYRQLTINNANVANLNFTSDFAINGRISNSSGPGLVGLRVYRTGGSVAAVTTPSGVGNSSTSFTVTP